MSRGKGPISAERDSDRSSTTDLGVLVELLASGLAEIQQFPDRPTLERLVELARLVASWNQRMNLTGHDGAQTVLSRLVADAVALLAALRSVARDWRSAVDLGSGAGFPGLPIALLEPKKRVVLVESRERRHHFQRAVCRELGLTNVEPRLGRVEALVPEPADLAIAQAMAAPSRVLGWGLGWVAPGGLLVIPGGDLPPDPGPHPEIAESGSRRYRVPLGGPGRSFWWGRRGGRT